MTNTIILITHLIQRAYAWAGHDYQVIAVRWIPVGGYQNLAQGHRQLGGNVVANFIRELVQQHGNLFFIFKLICALRKVWH